MQIDSLTYTPFHSCENPMLMDKPSISGVQLLEPVYWDKSLFFNVDSINRPKTVQEVRPAENHKGIRPVFSLGQLDGIFVMLLLSFLFLTHIYKSGILFFKENISFIYSTQKNVNQLNETTATDFWYNFLLLLQFVLMLSITLFDLLQQQNNDNIPSHPFLFVLLLMLGIMVAGLIKYLFYTFAGYLFDIQNAIRTWCRSYMILLEMMGLIAFIPVLFLIYSGYFHEFLINFLIGVFIFSRLIIIYRIGIFFIHRKVNILFSIAYLCSVEIIPYFVLYKGLLYFYNLSLLWL